VSRLRLILLVIFFIMVSFLLRRHGWAIASLLFDLQLAPSYQSDMKSG
jgi:hypothetical protein